MLMDAIAAYNIDPALSVMIGDKPRDVEAANGAGVRGILIEPDEQIDYELVKQVLSGTEFQVLSAGMKAL
ncbi:hypothetical protein D3C87_1813340 [compost metagenome]